MFKHFLPNERASRDEAFILDSPAAEAGASPRDKAWLQAGGRIGTQDSMQGDSPGCSEESTYHVPGLCMSPAGKKCGR